MNTSDSPLHNLGHVSAVDCRITFADGRPALTANDFAWARDTAGDGAIMLRGDGKGITATWTFTPWQGGWWVALALESDAPLNCAAICNAVIDYAPDTSDIGAWWTMNFGASVHTAGLHRIDELDERRRADRVMRGAFPDATNAGLFLGTRFPQTHEHGYSLDRIEGGLRFTSETRFRESIGRQTHLTSEATWMCAGKNARDALHAFAQHVPIQNTAPIPAGWNSWDYYFSSVALDDLIENMDAIRADATLGERMRYIVLDMGWEHVWGDWQPNHRFPGGLERVAHEVSARGFVPGIWTAPVCVQSLSYTALRRPEVLVKNAHGDPQPSVEANHFIVDPTHPAGEAFLRELYTRLHRIGFRLFKVDFVNDYTRSLRFHDESAGPYDAMRRLFQIIRECVGDDSHIIGCSLPPETGAGVADSGRIGIDIHNQWSHVEWVCDYLQMTWWLHRRVWINDPDFLVVRGRDTSREAETNVMNPNAHHPNPPRWRSGPVFTLDEARTWASIVMLAGGSVFLSDRIAMLNDAGRALMDKALAPLDVAAVPMDLCADKRASLWLQRLPQQTRLTVINWRNEAVTRAIDLTQCVEATPAQVSELWSEAMLPVVNGCVEVRLPAHGCAVLLWGDDGASV
jgi:hypothetical protein